MSAKNLPPIADNRRSRAAGRTGIEPVYLYVGDFPYQVEDAWNGLISSAGTSGRGKAASGGHASRASGGTERLRAKETSAGHVIEALSTVPMFGGSKFIMVEHVNEWVKDDLAALAAFIPRMPPSGCLVLTSPVKKGIEALLKAVEARGKVIELKAFSEKEAPRWLVQRASEKGKTLAFRAASLLVEMTGADLQTLMSELDKVCTFVGERPNIEPEDIEETASFQRTASTFELIDQVRARQGAKAVESLRGILLSGEPALKVLGTLAWQVRMLWQVKDGLRRGMSEAGLAAAMKKKPFAVMKAAEQATGFSDRELREIHEAIRRADVDIKSTGATPEVILEALVLDLCLKKEKPSSLR